MKKLFSILLVVLMLLTLFAGALAFLGYVVALCLGGESATELCAFIYKEFFPWVIRICSISVGFGLIGMYLNKTKALTMSGSEKSESK